MQMVLGCVAEQEGVSAHVAFQLTSERNLFEVLKGFTACFVITSFKMAAACDVSGTSLALSTHVSIARETRVQRCLFSLSLSLSLSLSFSLALALALFSTPILSQDTAVLFAPQWSVPLFAVAR